MWQSRHRPFSKAHKKLKLSVSVSFSLPWSPATLQVLLGLLKATLASLNVMWNFSSLTSATKESISPACTGDLPKDTPMQEDQRRSVSMDLLSTDCTLHWLSTNSVCPVIQPTTPQTASSNQLQTVVMASFLHWWVLCVLHEGLSKLLPRLIEYPNELHQHWPVSRNDHLRPIQLCLKYPDLFSQLQRQSLSTSRIKMPLESNGWRPKQNDRGAPALRFEAKKLLEMM